MASFASFKFEGTYILYFLKLCSIFVDPRMHLFNSQNAARYYYLLWIEAHSCYHDKLKLILHPELETPQPT